MSKFFEDDIGEISIKEKAEGESDFGIAVANPGDFGESREIKQFLSRFMDDLKSGEHQSKRFICKSENSSDVECEALFDETSADVTFKNMVIRYEDLDRINVYTDEVKESDGELIL